MVERLPDVSMVVICQGVSMVLELWPDYLHGGSEIAKVCQQCSGGGIDKVSTGGWTDGQIVSMLVERKLSCGYESAE